MRILCIDAATEHNETDIKILEDGETVLQAGVQLCMLYIKDVKAEDLTQMLKEEGSWLAECSGDVYSNPLVDATFIPGGSPFGTDMFALQVWTGDVLGRFNVTLIGLNESMVAALDGAAGKK